MEDTFVSRMLVDRESVGSETMVANHFTLKPGKTTDAGSHPAPYDELYYDLRGTGVVHIGEPNEDNDIGTDSVEFIWYLTATQSNPEQAKRKPDELRMISG